MNSPFPVNSLQRAHAAYREQFGTVPTAGAFAPGRVEIMGNHTDYNGGFVLPAALDKGTVMLGAPTGSDTIILYAADFRRMARFSVQTLQSDARNSWADYVLGVVQQLQRRGIAVGGFQAVLASDVPSGSGLSSSAALEVATAFFLKKCFPYELAPMEIARLSQQAENEFVGVQCGILDQFSSVFGRDGSLLFLDCLTLEHSAIKMGRDDIALVVCDSIVKHALTGGDYNTRRAECMAAAKAFGKNLLREVAWDEFTSGEMKLPPGQRKRARHILMEDKRVLLMRDAIARTDTAPIGRLLAEGHASCRDLFENTSPELDFLVDKAVEIDGCIGAKMTGGGWGGCTINLVHAEAVPQFSDALAAYYRDATGHEALIYPFRASQGAHILDLSL